MAEKQEDSPVVQHVSSPRSEFNSSAISTEHSAYLLQRHGTVDLDPLPSADSTDPYNWPDWKKNINLFVVSFQTMLTVFNAAGITTGIPALSVALDVSITKVTYLIGVQILFLGIAPLFWKPVAERYGRRPIWLVSAIGGTAFNIACAKTSSYGSQIATRILVAIFLSPSLGMGAAVVTETFFTKQRARKMGIWTLAFTIGPSLGPFIQGFVVYHTNSWRWIYWTFAIMNAASMVLITFFCPETLYDRFSTEPRPTSTISVIKREYFWFHRIDPKPFTIREIYEPFTMLRYPSVLLPAVAYSMIFALASVAPSIALPQAYTLKYGLNPQQLGYQFISIFIGSLIGEQIGGPLSDFVMNRKANALGGQRIPEFRLWASYLGFAAVFAGVLQWGITLQNSPIGRWTVVPDIGLGIASFGLQIVTTVLVTYAIDCYPHRSAAVGGSINQVRQIWSFLGPFWFTPMYDSLQYAKSAAVLTGMMFGLGFIPILALHLFGGKWRAPSVTVESDRFDDLKGSGNEAARPT